MKTANSGEIIASLQDCVKQCNHCATACLEENKAAMLIHCIRLDWDCADICELTVAFISRSSENKIPLIEHCVRVCERCAVECEKHAAQGMDHCRDCANSCRSCMAACIAYLN